MGDRVEVESTKEFVCRTTGIPFDTPDDFNYRKAGAVDSLGLVRMVISIEARFGIIFSDREIGEVEFDTVGGLVAMIEGKLA